MALVLDDTEERRRLEEEQALLEMEQLMASRIAPPDPQLPQEAIPAENVGFTNAADGQIQIDTPEGFAPPFNRQMIGDERYQQEVARAQRGSGFLAPEVGIAGGLVTPGYDPTIAEAAQRREQARLAAQAERFNGVQGYQQSIKSGATPAEALALWGPKMYAGNPGDLVSLVTRREPLARIAPQQKFVGGKMTPAIAAESSDLQADLRRQESALAKGTKPGLDKFGKKTEVPLNSEEVARLEANIGRIKGERKQLLSDPSINPNVDRTGWANMQEAWNRPTVQSKAAPAQSGPAAGTRARQNGVLYEFDGKAWKPVK